MVPERIYFAHPINTYDTEFETTLLELIAEKFPGIAIENPNQQKHQDGYKRVREATGDGMAYFFEEMLPTCDMCVALPFRDGEFGRGAAREIAWFKERNLPVYVFLPRMGVFVYLSGPFTADDGLSVEETRSRIRDADGNRIPY